MRHLRIGDLVRETDGCHVGEIVARFGCAPGGAACTIRVRWLDSGWRSDFEPEQLILAEKD